MEDKMPEESNETNESLPTNYGTFGGSYYHPWRASVEFVKVCRVPLAGTQPGGAGNTWDERSLSKTKGKGRPVAGSSLLTHAKLWNLMQLAKDCLHVEGEYWECGVFEGGSSTILGKVLSGSDKKLRLFDTFKGIPFCDTSLDHHIVGEMACESLEEIKELFSTEEDLKKVDTSFEVGLIPETFRGYEESTIALAHIDVDQYQSVKDAIEFIWPLVASGGVVVFDDYGVPSCMGARKATDDFCKDNSLNLITGMEGQAYLFKKIWTNKQKKYYW